MTSHTDVHNLITIARGDPARAERTGIPEIILAEGKTVAQTLRIAAAILENEGRALLSRVSAEVLAALHERFSGQVESSSSGTTVVLRGDGDTVPPTGGQVGILTAGTSDIAVAEEAAMLCRELGCAVQMACDVGVAGLHRLQEPLHAMLHEHPVDVLIVAAGMDGALPSVVAGLVDVPVIGLPTAVGYGLGGQGQAALYSMLQSCAPGLAVVNIDNGIGAGAMAARIANRAAQARECP
jgi:pyridinium-3,5-biscarboxylic acid mononucleotide synthase